MLKCLSHPGLIENNVVSVYQKLVRILQTPHIPSYISAQPYSSHAPKCPPHHSCVLTRGTVRCTLNPEGGFRGARECSRGATCNRGRHPPRAYCSFGYELYILSNTKAEAVFVSRVPYCPSGWQRFQNGSAPWCLGVPPVASV